MITAQELTQIQADWAAAFCNLSCIIQRKTKISDGFGSSSETWAAISPATLKAGMSQPSQQLLMNYGYRLESLNTWAVKLPYGVLMTNNTPIQAQDHLIIGGYTLEAHVALDPRSYPGLELWLAAVLKP